MFSPCLAVEFNSNKFGKHTSEQIDLDYLRKAIYTRVFSGFKCFRGYEVPTNFSGFKVSGHGTKPRKFTIRFVV